MCYDIENLEQTFGARPYAHWERVLLLFFLLPWHQKFVSDVSRGGVDIVFVRYESSKKKKICGHMFTTCSSLSRFDWIKWIVFHSTYQPKKQEFSRLKIKKIFIFFLEILLSQAEIGLIHNICARHAHEQSMGIISSGGKKKIEKNTINLFQQLYCTNVFNIHEMCIARNEHLSSFI